MTRSGRIALPAKITLPNGDLYVPAVMKIQTRDEHGRPEDLTHIPDDRTVELVGGEEFLIAYVKADMVERHP